MARLRSSLAIALAALLLVACQSAPVRDPDFAAVRPATLSTRYATPGAIDQAGYNLVLFQDMRARRVGDVLTIVLNEATDASKSAETTTSKTASNSVTNPTVLGSTVQFDVPRAFPLASTTNNNLGTSLSSDHDFSGSGESTQSNSLTGQITVSVAEVLPNGNLVVQGEKLLTLNQGNEHIRISGIVRPADIGADNTVPSARVADARIVYAGEGAVSDSNVVGWLSRFFMSMVFPF